MITINPFYHLRAPLVCCHGPVAPTTPEKRRQDRSDR